MFRTVVLLWAVVLAVIGTVRGFTGESDANDGSTPPAIVMPKTGVVLPLPDSLCTQDGRRIPALASSGPTFFLVARVDCPRCQTEVSTLYPTILRRVVDAGVPARVLLIPAEPAETEAFLNHLILPGVEIVFDSVSFIRGLGIGVAPSAVVVEASGVATNVYWPGFDWPADWPNSEEDFSVNHTSLPEGGAA